MKFIRLFFLLAIVLFIDNVATAHKGGNLMVINRADTIIKLDTTKNRDRKLLNKEPLPSKRGGRGGAKDTTNKGSLNSIVKTSAEDSTRSDQVHKITYLYGNAKVTYEDFELNADFIRVDQNRHLIFASGLIDPKTHRYLGKPISKQKGQSPTISDSLYFDYKTKRGKSWNTTTQQDGDFITGGQARVLNDQEVAYRNIIFSTCNLPYPETHFGIVITKGIGEKNRIVSGPAYLEIEGVPLPLALPFGFFPKPDHQTSGVLLPTFGEDARLGFYLRNLGYYLAFGDNLDLTTMGTIYSRGSYELTSTARYLKRYEYSGNLTLSYGSHNYGLNGDPPTQDFNITWSHQQDANAHPGTTFSASVNAGTSGFFKNNPAITNYNPQSLVQSSLQSSIAYGRVWAGTPFSLTATLSHRQDIANKLITLHLPDVTFNMTTINPFDSKERVGTQKWYQRITVGYTLQGTNSLSNIPESQLFQSATISRKLQSGILHTIPIGFNQTIFKYFQFNMSATYIDHWNFQTINEYYDRTNSLAVNGLVTDTVPGFKRAGEYTLSAGLSTKVYSRIDFKSGSLKAIRLVTTPTVSFSYRPDYTSTSYFYNRTVVSTATVPYPYTATSYSIFNSSAEGGPTGTRSAGIGFNLDNTIEAKVKAKSSDTSGKDRNIPIIQGLTLSTFYNFAADSFKLSPISLSGHTTVFNQKLGINFSGTLNPYEVKTLDSIGGGTLHKYVRTYDRYSILDGKLPQVSAFALSMNVSLNSNAFKQHTTSAPPGNSLSNMTPNQAERLAMINSDPSAFVDFNIPWNVVLNYNYTYANTNAVITTANTLTASGDFNLTPKWKIQYSTGYDLKAMKLSGVTAFTIYRDLHCWDLSIRWVPVGYYKSFSVDLKVKASILQDLKLSKRKDYYNNQ